MEPLWNQIAGADEDISALATVLRTLIIYALTLAIVRIGSPRMLGKASAFDVIVAIMLGSIMSRAINGSTALLPTLLAGGVLLAMHWLFAVIAYYTDWLGPIVKGDRILLIEEGEVQRQGLRRANLTSEDLAEALRLRAGHDDLAQIQCAYLERNGQVSVIPRQREPHVLDINLSQHVQTVRIKLQ